MVTFKLNSRYALELQVIDGVNIAIPSHRVPAGLYVSVSTPCGQWSTDIKTIKANYGVRWNEPLLIRGRPLIFPQWFMPIFPNTSKTVHLEVRASFETARLGRGELVGGVETTLQELLTNGTHFEIQFPATKNGSSSLLLQARRIRIKQPVDHSTIKPTEIDILTDEAHEEYARYRTDNRHNLDGAIRDFQAVCDQCPDGHPHRAAALSNLAYAVAHTDIDRAISLFRSALELRPLGHPDHPQSIHNLCKAHYQRYLGHRDHTDLCETLKLYHKLLPICPKDSYFHSCVTEEYDALPKDPSDESEPPLHPPDHLVPLSQHREADLEPQGGQVNGIPEPGEGRPSENSLPYSVADKKCSHLWRSRLRGKFSYQCNCANSVCDDI